MSPPISSDTTTSHTELPLRKGELESSLAEICEDPLVIGDLVQVSARYVNHSFLHVFVTTTSLMPRWSRS